MQVPLSLSDFSKAIEHIQDIHTLADDIWTTCAYYNTNHTFGINFDFPTLEEDVVKLLQIMMKDTDEWISYFIYELNFGEKWEPNCVTDKEGNDVPLKTIEDLYLFLTTNK